MRTRLAKQWTGLTFREQGMVGGALLLVSLLLLYTLIIEPLMENRSNLSQQKVPSLKEDLRRMRMLQREASELDQVGAPPDSSETANNDRVKTIKESAKEASLKIIAMNQASGETRLTISAAPLHSLTSWLESLHTSHGLILGSASLISDKSGNSLSGEIVLKQ